MVRIMVKCPRCYSEDEQRPWLENAFMKAHVEGGRRVCPWGCGHQGLHVGYEDKVGKPLKS